MSTKIVPPPKLLALDVGDARVGVALGSRFPSHAEPLTTLKRARGFAEDRILGLIEEYLIETVVVGLPLSVDGQANQQCSKIEKFCRRLQRRASVNIEFIDEYGSSKEAEEMFSGSTLHAATKSRHGSDAIAAALILRRYLDGAALS